MSVAVVSVSVAFMLFASGRSDLVCVLTVYADLFWFGIVRCVV